MQEKKSMDALERISISEFKQAQKTPVIVVLDNVRSMNNVGSVFRSADCFRIEAIYLCGHTPIPPHRDIAKTALGATETVAWKYFDTTIQALHALHENKTQIIAIEQVHNSISLEKFSIDTNTTYALVFGNEVDGVDQEVIVQCHSVIEIPQSGSKHSFNISVSAGIVLWQFYKQWLS
jgi:23S rRNA (guanosine2251-2'-O)-methyltransferase